MNVLFYFCDDLYALQVQTKEQKSYIVKPSKKYLKQIRNAQNLALRQVLAFPGGYLGNRLQIDVSYHACKNETNLIVGKTLV